MWKGFQTVIVTPNSRCQLHLWCDKRGQLSPYRTQWDWSLFVDCCHYSGDTQLQISLCSGPPNACALPVWHLYACLWEVCNWCPISQITEVDQDSPAFILSLYLSGGFNAALRSATDEEKDYQDMICLGRKGGRFSQRRRAQSLSLQGLLLGSFA